MPRVWFVTGSSRGLGLALVEAILESGDSVVATARNANSLTHLADKYGFERVLTAALDVANNDQVLKVVQLAHETFGRIDLVVNNAGYADTASIEDMPVKSFRTQMETNFFGVINVTKAVIPILRKQGSGHILQVSSVGDRIASAGLSSYQSAKWAVCGFSGVLAQEVGPLGIKVTVLEPGGIKTDWAGSSMGYLDVSEPYQATVGTFKAMRDRLKDTWAEPSQMAKAILHISNVSDPPLRLLLGSDIVDYAKFMAKELATSDEKWEEVTKLNV